MKLFASAAVAFFLLLAVHLSLQIPVLVNCPDDFLDKHPDLATECAKIRCPGLDDHTNYTYYTEPCRVVECFEGVVGLIEGNNSLAYPDCCDDVICSAGLFEETSP